VPLRLLPVLAVLLLLAPTRLAAQFTDSSSGLLQMPSAEMQPEGTFMITNNSLNPRSLPTSGWSYRTFAYGFSFTFWSRLEVGYVCTIFDGSKIPGSTGRQRLMFNQDRHFTGRFQLLREGEFGLRWMPSLVVGVSDPTTGSSANGYVDTSVEGTGNGYFNREYIALSKHFNTPLGELGGHLAYQYNRRSDYRLNGPCAAVTFTPDLLRYRSILDAIRFIAEYDARTFNLGCIASVWENRFEAMVELQALKYVNFGVRYKLRLK